VADAVPSRPVNFEHGTRRSAWRASGSPPVRIHPDENLRFSQRRQTMRISDTALLNQILRNPATAADCPRCPGAGT
jgi:hypothetical protein